MRPLFHTHTHTHWQRELNTGLYTQPRTRVLEEGAVWSRGERRGKGDRCQYVLLIRTRGGGRKDGQKDGEEKKRKTGRM